MTAVWPRCVCLCLCVGVCARACACACVRVCVWWVGVCGGASNLIKRLAGLEEKLRGQGREVAQVRLECGVPANSINTTEEKFTIGPQQSKHTNKTKQQTKQLYRV